MARSHSTLFGGKKPKTGKKVETERKIRIFSFQNESLKNFMCRTAEILAENPGFPLDFRLSICFRRKGCSVNEP